MWERHADPSVRRVSKPMPEPAYMVKKPEYEDEPVRTVTVNKPESSVDQSKELLKKLLAILTPAVPALARAPEPSSMDNLVQLLIGKFAKNTPAPPAPAEPTKLETMLRTYFGGKQSPSQQSRLRPVRRNWSDVKCFSCGKTGHSATRCPMLDVTFPFILPGWKAKKTSTGYLKLEPICIAEHEHALIAAGYSVYRGVPRSSCRGGRNARGNRWKPRGSSGRHVNPTGMDGKAMLCNYCGSYRHMMINCPDSWENMGNRDTKVNIVEQTGNYGHGSEQVVLFTGFQQDSLREFTKDAQNCIVLDSACSSNVCGREWMDTYLETLSPNDRSKVVQVPGHKVFKFGGGERLTSQSSLTIPGQLAGKPVMINIDVVESDIPLLMSKDAMKRAKIKLNLQNDTAEVFGVPVSLNLTSSGHYCLPIDQAGNIPLENVCVVLQQLDEKGKRDTLIKLHRQFAHPMPQRRNWCHYLKMQMCVQRT